MLLGVAGVHWFAALGSVAPSDAFAPFRLSATCPACLPCRVLHGSEGSAWAWNLGLPLSDLRLLCVSVAGGESRKTFTQFSKRENVKT